MLKLTLTFIYTDGAKNPDNGKTGFGVSIPGKDIMISKRTSDKFNVYTVEILAILMALYWVEEAKTRKVLICQIRILYFPVYFTLNIKQMSPLQLSLPFLLPHLISFFP